MILNAIIRLGLLVVTAFFNLFIPIPHIPATALAKITSVKAMIFNNLNLLPLFIRINTITTIVQILLIVIALKESYYITMWVLKKIPVLGIN